MTNRQTKITCTRKIHFCAGHRVLGHENKCATPHGHNYNVFVSAESEDLDPLGRVIDFSVLKNNLGGWIDKNWDHTFLVYEKDQVLIEALQKVGGHKPIYLCSFNPTAENMAQYLLNTVSPMVFKEPGVKVTKIALYESENCYAEASIF